MPAWWSPDKWVNLDVWCAVAGAPEVCRDEHVDPQTVVRVARAHADYADRGTGRSCRPTNERLADDLRLSVRQIQRARAALKRLKLLVEVVRGRSIMTRAERLQAWRNGSAHRRIASEFALIGRRRHPQGCRCTVDRVTPPSTTVGGLGISPKRGFFTSGKTDRRTGLRPAPTQKRRGTRSALRDARTSRLIAGVQGRVGWLTGVSPRRLTILARFAAHDWTPRDVLIACDGVLKARGWTVPNVVTQPPAYLAALMRDIDPADRPTAHEAELAERELARRAWIYETTFGQHECPHGQPGGDLVHPLNGSMACPLCRHAPTIRA